VEVGCSYGGTTKCLALQCARVVAVDISAECILDCQEKFPELQFEQLDVLQVPPLTLCATMLVDITD
jgi:cyclopropane fatty-acyl-phospholipid synthase-like methyltransferase